ncbi:MAG: outer membrane protein [bacterium]
MKLLKSKLFVIILALGVLSFNIQLAAAEVFVDLHAGLASGSYENLTALAPAGKSIERVDLGNSFTIGYRLGYWFKGFRWAGVAVEASHFKHDIQKDGFDYGHLRITPVSSMLMFRLPLLKKDNYSAGELLLYGGIGPGLFLSSIKVDYSLFSGSGKYSERAVDIGLDMRAGIEKMISENISLFCEYRYTDFKPDFKNDDDSGNSVKIETEVNTHHVLIGFSYHYN